MFVGVFGSGSPMTTMSESSQSAHHHWDGHGQYIFNSSGQALGLCNLRSLGGKTSHTLLSAKMMAKIDSGIANAAYQVAMCLCAVFPSNATPIKKGASRQSTRYSARLSWRISFGGNGCAFRTVGKSPLDATDPSCSDSGSIMVLLLKWRLGLVRLQQLPAVIA